MENNKFMIGEYIQKCNPDGELLGLPFQATNIDFLFQDGRFVKVDSKETYLPKSKYDKLKEERNLLIEVLRNIVDSWNKRMGGDEEEFKTININGHQLYFWSPVASLVDSEQIHKAKELLTIIKK